MSNTLSNVLAHHGIVGEGDTLTDNAREAGLIFACLGCGSVAGIDMTISDESNRIATRDAINFDEWDCCPDENTIVF